MARTPEEVEEERYLVAELKKFQHHRKKAAKEAVRHCNVAVVSFHPFWLSDGGVNPHIALLM